jgi:FkbM family methyltransferase
MTEKKPRDPYPLLLRRLLRRTLPHPVYRRYLGRHEDGSIALWRRFALSLPPGTAILDIGAFHGEYSLAAKEVNPTARVIAFEPNPESLQVLHKSCDPIGVEISPFAVAEASGVVRFLCKSEQSRITTGAEITSSQEEMVPVQVVSLDSWTSDNGLLPSLIKMDTEGGEAGILRGSRRVLIDCQPIILCEVLSDSAGTDVMAALPSCYRFWYVDENTGVAEQRTRITRQYWRNKNWLLLPEGRVPN